jgi:hypothetical protein
MYADFKVRRVSNFSNVFNNFSQIHRARLMLTRLTLL